MRHGVPTQEIDAPKDWQLTVRELQASAAVPSQTEINKEVERLTLEPIDIARGPLFDASLLRIAEGEHVLIVAMEHLISDMASLSIFLRDLLIAYHQAEQRHEFSLPQVPVQLADYGVWQTKAQRLWIDTHGSYWNGRLAACGRLRFPADKSLPFEAGLGWGMAAIHIGSDLKFKLHEWSKGRRTTLVMTTFSVYVGLVFRWCQASDAVFLHQSDGRFSRKVMNTIGYFTFPLYLRMQLLANDSFNDLLDKSIEEYCNAHEHADYSYLEAQWPRPEFTRNTAFNWVPQGPRGEPLSDVRPGSITHSSLQFDQPFLMRLEKDVEPCLVLFDEGKEIRGGIYYPHHKFSAGSMNRFARSYLSSLEALLADPSSRVRDLSLAQ